MSSPPYAQQDKARNPFEKTWGVPPGLVGRLTTVQNGPIGKRIVVTAFFFFLLGGINALLIRLQLIRPHNEFLGPETYNGLFTMHGSTMMYLFAVPFLEGLATLVLPQLLGARDLPFPRMTTFAFWTFLLGGLVFYSSFLFSLPGVGWFAYVPLSGAAFSPDLGVDFWLLGLSVAEIGAIAGAIELIISFFKMRAPGMSLNRIPLFAWAIVVMAFSMLFAFTPLLVGSLMLELDRKFGTHFFNPDAGGSPLLWQHLFWIFGHPEVYIQFIPATGIVSMVVATFARRPLVGYPFVVVSIVATGFISFGLWVHHMFTTGLPYLSMFFFTVASMIIAIPSGVQIFSWIATIWAGRPVWKTSLLFVFGFIVTFVLGGLTGVMVASIPFDWQVHDTYFVVAHFHYVLIGGVVFPVFAGIYYWAPKYMGKMLDERLGKLNFWLMFIGFHVTFFPMHLLGFWGMPRRVYTYDPWEGWALLNLIATIGAFILASGVLVFIVNIVWSYLRAEKAPDNPWNAGTLEWSTDTPSPPWGFRTFPIAHSRYPLWDERKPHEGHEKLEELVKDLADWPEKWRAQIVTSTFDGMPQEVFRVADSSIWPLSLSLGITFVFVGFLFNAYFVVGAGALLSAVSLLAWHWPEEEKVTEDTTRDEEFERKHGIPVRAAGSRIVSRWGMVLALTVVAIILGSGVFSYFYIRLDAEVWPPTGIEPPELLWPGVGIALLVLSAAATYWALRAIRGGDQTGLKVGLGAALLLVLGFLGIELFDYLQLDFNWRTHAYGSLVYLVGGLMGLTAAIGAGMSVVVQYWAWRNHYSARRYGAIETMAIYWYFMVGAGVLIFATLYLYPHL